MTDDVPPPKIPEELNELPQMREGDEVAVETLVGSKPKALTVTDTDPDPIETDTADVTRETPQVLLTGYGTEYRLVIERDWSGDWQRVRLLWPSKSDGLPVESIEVKKS